MIWPRTLRMGILSTMKKEIITSSNASAHILSKAIETNGFVYLSGQVHCDDNLVLVGETVAEKLDVIMKSIESTLRTAGLGLDDIVKVVIYVTDMAQMPEFNEAYAHYFSAPLPVREAVCVSALPLGATIEISVVAAR